MSEKRIDQSHDIFEMVRALCLQQTVDYVARVEERLCQRFHQRNEKPVSMTVGIPQNKKKRPIIHLCPKSFFSLSYELELLPFR